MTTAALSDGRNDPLLLAGRILTIIMQVALALAGLAFVIAAPVVLFFKDEINTKILAEHGPEMAAFPAFQVAAAILLAAVAIALMFKFFGNLRAIINSVGDGDPFAPENADRLTGMAWLSLGTYAVAAAIIAVVYSAAEWVNKIDDAEFNSDGSFDLTGILMIIILFILARVFRHGTAMRDDLEGTV